MRREDRFVFSHRPYAVDLDSLRPKYEDREGSFVLDAVWFRRKYGVTAACTGVLWDFQRPEPTGAVEFLARHEDGRYGGDCRSRWDGESFWSASQDPDVHMVDLALLRRLLTAYEADPKNPALDTRHDGWWVF